MTIVAKFPGTCSVCGRAIVPGQKIEWQRGSDSRHTDCQPVVVPADAIYLTGCGSVELWQQDQVIRDHAGRYLVVLQASRRHFDEDAMSFGDDDDCGWVAYATCRLATDEEAAPVIAAAEQRKQEQAEQVRRAAEEKEGVRVDYSIWRSEHLDGLVATTVFPELTDLESIYGCPEPSDLTIQSRSGESYHAPKSAGWYTTGDHYQRLSWRGQDVGWCLSYGNVTLCYVPADLADVWYAERWLGEQQKKGVAGVSQEALCWITEYGTEGVIGADYYAYLDRVVGRDELARRASAEPFRLVNDASLVEKLRAAGVSDVRKLVGTGEQQNYDPVYRDPVDGSRWLYRSYGRLERLP